MCDGDKPLGGRKSGECRLVVERIACISEDVDEYLVRKSMPWWNYPRGLDVILESPDR